MDNGFNPMRYSCEKSGCFNKKKRPKIEIFSNLFPGKISFGDVDAIVEINGKALILEWKEPGCKIGTGQRIMWCRMTRSNLISVLVVEGNAETMDVSAVGFFSGGIYTEPTESNLENLKQIISKWVNFAKTSSQN